MDTIDHNSNGDKFAEAMFNNKLVLIRRTKNTMEVAREQKS